MTNIANTRNIELATWLLKFFQVFSLEDRYFHDRENWSNEFVCVSVHLTVSMCVCVLEALIVLLLCLVYIAVDCLCLCLRIHRCVLVFMCVHLCFARVFTWQAIAEVG